MDESKLARLTPRLLKGMGHVPAAWAHETPSTRELFGAPRGLPFHARALERWVAFDAASRLRDQEQTEECVGEGTARILHVRLCHQVAGARPVRYPSQPWIYKLARELDLPKNAPLADEGSRPDLAFRGLQLRGILAEQDMPFSTDPDLVNARIDADQVVAAYEARVVGNYRIDSTGSALVDDSKNALAQFHPFALAVQVDDAFENYDGTHDIAVPEGKIYGGHYIAVVGYEGDRFRIVNSWGASWGDRGMGWMTADAVMRATDHNVVTVVPAYDMPRPKAA